MKISISPSAVQTYLSQNLSKLRPTTSLIISSAPPPPTSSSTSSTSPNKKDHPLQKFHNQISSHTKSIHFFATMQHNLKTVQYGEKTLTSSFPTQENVNLTLEFIRRTIGGSGSSGSSDGGRNLENAIIGVGNGAAIDLAKACYLMNKKENRREGEGQQLVLIPSTLGSALACTSSQSLILDVHEEALVTSPSPSSSSSNNANDENVHVLVDETSMAIPSWVKSRRNTSRGNVPTVIDAALASLAIAIDTQITLLEMSNNDQIQNEEHRQKIIDQSIQMSVSCLEQILAMEMNINDVGNDIDISAEKQIKSDAIQATLNAGQLLSFGNNNDNGMRRNIALSLSSALLPKYFPRGNWLTFTASLLPGLIQSMDHLGIQMNNITPSLEWVKEELIMNHSEIIPSLSSLADGAPDVNQLSQKFDDNGALLNCLDCDVEFMEHVLMVSLNR
jgi:hypothetical protein